MSIIILALFCASLANSLKVENNDEDWKVFKAKFSKDYDSVDEELKRLAIFKQNVYRISLHNSKFERGEVSHKLGINQFSDMNPDEIPKGLIHIGSEDSICGGQVHEPRFHDAQIPDAVDWRTKGVVTEVKDQGNCGSCWAFSATGALEGQHALKTKKLVSLSEQELVDCDKLDKGCIDGSTSTAYEYIEKHGIDSEESYPYEAVNTTCRFKESSVAATCKGCRQVQPTEDALKEAVATVGPISVAIDASGEFVLYAGGIYKNPECSTTSLDHGVLVVGYGTTEKGEDYWLVKNSWGKTWGDQGYIKMARNFNDMCGIATNAIYPIV